MTNTMQKGFKSQGSDRNGIQREWVPIPREEPEMNNLFKTRTKAHQIIGQTNDKEEWLVDHHQREFEHILQSIVNELNDSLAELISSYNNLRSDVYAGEIDISNEDQEEIRTYLKLVALRCIRMGSILRNLAEGAEVDFAKFDRITNFLKNDTGEGWVKMMPSGIPGMGYIKLAS